MRSLVMIFTLSLAFAWQLGGFELSEGSFVGLLMIGAVFGMPHGASDIVVAHRAFSSMERTWVAIGSYSILYLALTSVVLLLWLASPLLCTIGFLIISWMHFGDFHDEATMGEEDEGAILQRIIDGGLPVLVPLLTMKDQAWLAIGWLAERDGRDLMASFRGTGEIILWAVIGSTIVLWLIQNRSRIAFARSLTDKVFTPPSRWILIALLFASVPPLLAFAVYFVLWHAPQHMSSMMRDAKQENGSGTSSIEMILLVIASILPLIVGAWVISTNPEPTQLLKSVTRTTFIGLAALTVPHIFNGHLITLAKQFCHGVIARSRAA